MDTKEIKSIIIDQKEELDDLFAKEKIITREVSSEKLLKFLKYPNILAILGIRRSGKSVLSAILLKNQKYGYINFNDERLAGLQADNLNKILQAFYELYGKDLDHILLDEIQNIPGWELFANRLRRTKKLIITGSNANLLSGELATHLTGRYIDFSLYPFSFREFLRLQEQEVKDPDLYSTKQKAEIKSFLENYLSQGGFPEVYKFGKPILKRIYSDIINKDIILRYKIRHKNTFKQLAKYLVSNYAQEITFRKLKNIAVIKDVHTIKNYVDYLASAYLIILLERFSFKLKQQMIAPKKIYCIDNGIANAVSFRFSEDQGRAMENLVAVELYRQSSYADEGFEIYYWKDHIGREVDFLIKQGQKITQLIQVCYNLSEAKISSSAYNLNDEQTKTREINLCLKPAKNSNVIIF